MDYSLIIPVYNRPSEIDELLNSISKQKRDIEFEVIIVDDGSKKTSENVVKDYQTFLDIKYIYKENTGPGDSRNKGAEIAKGEYLIFLDSDCILPNTYLESVSKALSEDYSDAFGGPDLAHDNFSDWQKAINYSMTSILTTGGVRGSDKLKQKFQLRSFNLGISKEVFNKIEGFAKQRFGEDIDLTFRLWSTNYSTQFIAQAAVYHKRRTTWIQFFKQVFNFGAARPVLNEKYPSSSKLTFWFPSAFTLGVLLMFLGLAYDIQFLAILYVIYFLVIFFDALVKNRNLFVAVLAIFTTLTQFLGYGLGFLRSVIRLKILRQSHERSFHKMFE